MENDFKEEKVAFAKLPPVAGIQDTGKRLRVMELMEQLETILAQKSNLLVMEDEAKDELERMQKEMAKPGFRHGWLAFCSQQVKGRRTLDKMLLLENGCPAAILNQSYKTGEPYVRNIFKRLDEEDG